MSKVIKKVVNGKVQFYYLGKRISPSQYYKLRFELKE